MVNTGLAGQSDWIHRYSPPPLVFIQSPTPFTAVIISNTRLSLARAGNWAEISLHPGHKCCIYHKQPRAKLRWDCVWACVWDRGFKWYGFFQDWCHYFSVEMTNNIQYSQYALQWTGDHPMSGIGSSDGQFLWFWLCGKAFKTALEPNWNSVYLSYNSTAIVYIFTLSKTHCIIWWP